MAVSNAKVTVRTNSSLLNSYKLDLICHIGSALDLSRRIPLSRSHLSVAVDKDGDYSDKEEPKPTITVILRTFLIM